MLITLKIGLNYNNVDSLFVYSMFIHILLTYKSLIIKYLINFFDKVMILWIICFYWLSVDRVWTIWL